MNNDFNLLHTNIILFGYFLESDVELEGLIPEESDANMDLLSIEQDQNQIIDEKQNLGK